jgi:uncharacterized protein (TIGR00369 family)
MIMIMIGVVLVAERMAPRCGQAITVGMSGMTENGAIQPATAEVQAQIRASFERQGLMRHLGARLGEIGHGLVRIKLSARPEVSQQHGYVHAGAIAAIADSAGGYAALTMMPEDSEVLTVEYKINFLAPAAGDLEAVGWVLRSGRTLTVCRVEVVSTTASERTVVASGQQTLVRVPSQSA